MTGTGQLLSEIEGAMAMHRQRKHQQSSQGQHRITEEADVIQHWKGDPADSESSEACKQRESIDMTEVMHERRVWDSTLAEHR